MSDCRDVDEKLDNDEEEELMGGTDSPLLAACHTPPMFQKKSQGAGSGDSRKTSARSSGSTKQRTNGGSKVQPNSTTSGASKFAVSGVTTKTRDAEIDSILSGALTYRTSSGGQRSLLGYSRDSPNRIGSKPVQAVSTSRSCASDYESGTAFVATTSNKAASPAVANEACHFVLVFGGNSPTGHKDSSSSIGSGGSSAGGTTSSPQSTVTANRISAAAPTAQYVDEDSLTPLSPPPGKDFLQSLTAKLNTDDWQIQFDSLTDLRRLVKHHTNVFSSSGVPNNGRKAAPAALQGVISALLTLTDSLRSNVAKNALLCIYEMYKFIPQIMSDSSITERMVSMCLRKAASAGAGSFLIAEVERAIKQLCVSVTNEGRLAMNLQRLLKDGKPSQKFKTAVAMCLTLVFLRVTENGILSLIPAKDAPGFVRSINRLAVEASPETRKFGKASLIAFALGLGSFDKLKGLQIPDEDVKEMQSLIKSNWGKVDFETLLGIQITGGISKLLVTNNPFGAAASSSHTSTRASGVAHDKSYQTRSATPLASSHGGVRLPQYPVGGDRSESRHFSVRESGFSNNSRTSQMLLRDRMLDDLFLFDLGEKDCSERRSGGGSGNSNKANGSSGHNAALPPLPTLPLHGDAHTLSTPRPGSPQRKSSEAGVIDGRPRTPPRSRRSSLDLAGSPYASSASGRTWTPVPQRKTQINHSSTSKCKATLARDKRSGTQHFDSTNSSTSDLVEARRRSVGGVTPLRSQSSFQSVEIGFKGNAPNSSSKVPQSAPRTPVSRPPHPPTTPTESGGRAMTPRRSVAKQGSFSATRAQTVCPRHLLSDSRTTPPPVSRHESFSGRPDSVPPAPQLAGTSRHRGPPTAPPRTPARNTPSREGSIVAMWPVEAIDEVCTFALPTLAARARSQGKIIIQDARKGKAPTLLSKPYSTGKTRNSS